MVCQMENHVTIRVHVEFPDALMKRGWCCAKTLYLHHASSDVESQVLSKATARINDHLMSPNATQKTLS